MGFFKDFGKFVTQGIPRLVTKDIPKVVTKDIPRAVTEDIPRIVTKEIPEAVTEDIPRIVTKEIPEAVTEDIPKILTEDIPRLVTKDIPKAVTEDIPEYFSEDIKEWSKRETHAPELVGLRETVAGQERSIVEKREALLALRASFDEKRAAYVRLSEDYENRTGQRAAEARVGHVADRDWDDPVAGGNKVLEGLDGSFRFIARFATLGIAEVAWAPGEAKKEKEFLVERKAALAAILARLDAAIGELEDANRGWDEGIARICAELGASAEEAAEAVDDRRLETSQDAAQLEVAGRMLEAGATPEQIALLTGLEPQAVAELAAERGAVPAAEPEHSQEARLAAARSLLADGLEDEDVVLLSGLEAETVGGLRAETTTETTEEPSA